MTAKVLAICLPALRGKLRPSNMPVCEVGDGDGDGSTIVAYEETRRIKRMFLFVNENMNMKI